MYTKFLKSTAVALACTGMLLTSNVEAQVASDTATTTTAVHDAAGAGVVLDSGDFYASGNDDAFAEYGLATFNFTSADFGGVVTAINSVDFALTVNDRTFSDGAAVEVFFTPDTGADLDSGGGNFSALAYDVGVVNGLDVSQYVTAPTSMGVFAVTEMAGRPGGEVDVLSLSFTGANEAALISAINSGTDFQLLIGATDTSHDMTYSGFGNTFDPGDPSLTINAVTAAVPEPSTGVIFGVLAIAGVVRRRR